MIKEHPIDIFYHDNETHTDTLVYPQVSIEAYMNLPDRSEEYGHYWYRYCNEHLTHDDQREE